MSTKAQALLQAADALSRRLSRLRFTQPIAWVYNPFVYARAPYAEYLTRYATGPKQVLFLGMNPGPFGMAQTGVPFGDVSMVRDWLGIEAEVAKPPREHPKRLITGFACLRSEVSGARLWGMWRERYRTPEHFFAWAFVANYCPLVFMEASGRNLTPDKLAVSERTALLRACDQHLHDVIATLEPSWIVGVGKFAEARARTILKAHRFDCGQAHVASMPHPSPASPLANRNWSDTAIKALLAQGVPLAPARAEGWEQ